MADFTTSKVDGNTVDATEWNQLADLDNAVTSSGQTPSTGNLNQLGIAMAINAAGADFYSDSGTANTYVLTAIAALRSPHAYFDGMRVRFRPDNANTGASTVDVATLGVKSIKRSDGTTATSTGDIVANADAELRYDLANGVFILSGANLQATESLKGLAELATQAETNAGTNDTTIVTPLKLKTSVYNSRELILSQTASNAPSIEFTGSWAAFSEIEVDFNNIVPTVDGAGLIMQVSTDNGATFINSLYESDGLYHEAGAGPSLVDTVNNATRFTLVGFDALAGRGISNTSTKGGLSGSIKIFNPASTAQHKVLGDVVYPANGADYITKFYIFGRQFGTTAINGIRFKMSTANADTNNGTIASGTFKLYGIK